jgi:hypothetical protein
MSLPGEFHEKDISIGALAQRVASLSSQICSYLTLHSFSEPNFAADGGSVPETPDYEALRAPLNDAALDLLRLVNGPKHTLRKLVFSHYDLAALQIALDRRLFDHVPLPSTAAPADSVYKASVAEIAQKAGMDEDRTGRVMKMLATHRIFEEVEGERESFTHTANSAFLARDDEFHDTADMQMDDMLRAASEASAMISASPYGKDASQSAFHQRFGIPMYQYYEQRPEKARRFARAMSSYSQSKAGVT